MSKAHELFEMLSTKVSESGDEGGHRLSYHRFSDRSTPLSHNCARVPTVLGEETKAQLLEQRGKLPDGVVACIGGGSNAIGMFYPFLNDPSVKLMGVEAGGDGLDMQKHAASLTGGSKGVLHGSRTYVLQDKHGQIQDTHSISAGLIMLALGK